MDAIQLVKKDHRTVEQLFRRFERAEKAGRAAEQRKVVRELIRELSVHAAVEEQLLYPVLRRKVESTEDQVLESLEEHHLVKLTLSELAGMAPSDERFSPKVSVLMESVRHHVEEEEHELLPRLAKTLSPRDRRELGDALETLKKTAPTRPHPAAPDTPPGNFVAGVLSAVLDRGRDAVRGLAERGRERGERAGQRMQRASRSAADGARQRARGATRRARAAARQVRREEHRPTVH